jgi:hypothetical protein
MKNYILCLALALIAFSSYSFAQVPYNSAVPNGYTKKAIVSEQVGLTQVSITYHRHAVKGREGKIWGEIVPKGFIDQGFGNGKPTPWRAGANENTVIEFDNDLKIEGQTLPKERYGLFIAYDPSESIVIFSKRSDAWGSFFYDEKEDALRSSFLKTVNTPITVLNSRAKELSPLRTRARFNLKAAISTAAKRRRLTARTNSFWFFRRFQTIAGRAD